MQGWMIALIIVACVIAALAVAFLIGALAAVHIILGRRKTPVAKPDTVDDPDRYGVNRAWFDGVADVTETLELTAYDGIALSALLIKQKTPAGRVAICCHGYGATQRAMQVQAKLFYDRGFDVLLPAMRGHGASGGKVGMAWLDRFDLLRWVDKLVSDYGEKVSIALCGISMGGSTVVAAAGMNPPPQVKCVINDCGFSSQVDVYGAHIGKVPKALGLLPLAVGARLVHGYSIYDADITKLAENMSVPALFIHGEADRFVPPPLGQKLYDSCGSANKRFFSVPNAAHALAYAVDREGYSQAFNSFVDEYVEGSEFVFDSNTLIPEKPSVPEKDGDDGAVDTDDVAAPVAETQSGEHTADGASSVGDADPDASAPVESDTALSD